MKRSFSLYGVVVCLLIAVATPTLAQRERRDGEQGSGAVPRLVKYGDVVRDGAGAPRRGTVGVTFAVYAEREGGSALWMETQNVELDEQGRYNVMLGAMTRDGLPTDLFAAGESRWLSVHVQLPGETEQARVLLVSVPYAMRAEDAASLGGRPATDYVLREHLTGWSGVLPVTPATQEPPGGGGSKFVVSATGTVNFVPKATVVAGADVTYANSQIFDNGTNVGIGTTTPAGLLDINLTTNTNRNSLNTTVALNNSAPINGAVISALNMQLIDQSTANNLSKQSARMVYIRDGAATGGVLAFDTIFTTSAFLNANAPYQLRGANFEFPRVLAGRTLGTYIGLYMEGPQAGNGAVTNKFAMVMEPGAGNVGIGTTAPTQLLEVAGGNIKLTGAGNAIIFPDGTVMGTATTGTGGGTITGVSAGIGLAGGGTAGGVTLGLVPCPINQVLKSSGTSWICADDLSGGGSGTVTSITGGTGLVGGTITTTGTLGVNFTTAGGDAGSAATVARGDHAHNSTYLPLGGGALTGGLTGTTGNFTGSLSGLTGTFAGTLNVSATTTTAGLALPPVGTATPAAGTNSNRIDMSASTIDTDAGPFATLQTYRWQAAPVANNTVSPSANLNLLFGAGLNPTTNVFTVLGASGNVGIGTAAPGQKLSVAGVIESTTGGFRFPDGSVQTTAGGGGGGSGDITAVVTGAGSGMQGGVATGDAVLSLLTSCTPNQLLKWSGTAWACASDEIGAAGTGDITDVLTPAGSGLTGGQTTGPVSLAVNFTTAGGDNGSATNVARGDHTHNSVYLPLTGGTLTGVLNLPTMNVNATSATIGVDASITNASGTAVRAIASDPMGSTIGLRASVASPSGVAGLFDSNQVNGTILRGVAGGTERFRVSGLGEATATDFLDLATSKKVSLRLDCASGQVMKYNGTNWQCDNDATGGGGGGGGDIDGVLTAVGSGLQGGVSAGTANLSLLTSCGTGQVLKWSGTSWACAPDLDTNSFGTVTSINTGLGLTGGPINTMGVIAIDPAVVPQLNVGNVFTAPQTINGNLTVGGTLFAVDSATQSVHVRASSPLTSASLDVQRAGVEESDNYGLFISNNTTNAVQIPLKYGAFIQSLGTVNWDSFGTRIFNATESNNNSAFKWGLLVESTGENTTTINVGVEAFNGTTNSTQDGMDRVAGRFVSNGFFAGGAGPNTRAIGVYGTAAGADVNLAGLFDGDVQVNGQMTATSFVGDGSLLTNVVASNASSLGGLPLSAFARYATAGAFTTQQTFSTAPAFTAGGTPFTVSSGTLVSNLNADFLDGLTSADFGRVNAANNFGGTNTFTGTSVFNGTLNADGGTLFVDIVNNRVGVNSLAPGVPLDVVGAVRTNNQFISTVAAGTAPFAVTSPTHVPNLNADMLDGLNSSQLARTDIGNIFAGSQNFSANTLFVDSINSRVGLGIATPLTQFQLHAAAGGNALKFSQASFNQVNSGRIEFHEGNGTYASNAFGVALNLDGSSNNFSIQSMNGAVVTDVLSINWPSNSITMTGNVAIAGASSTVTFPDGSSQRSATMWAVVTSAGAISRSSPGVAAANLAAGQFEVIFPINIRNCGYTATIATDTTITAGNGIVIPSHRSTNVNGIFVVTRNLAGANVDLPFHVSVTC